MKSIAWMLRRVAFAGIAAVGCFSAGDKDGDGEGGVGGSNQCSGFAPVPCRCLNGANGFAECDNGVRGSCVCDNNGGTAGSGNTGNTGNVGNTGNTAGIGNTGNE